MQVFYRGSNSHSFTHWNKPLNGWAAKKVFGQKHYFVRLLVADIDKKYKETQKIMFYIDKLPVVRKSFAFHFVVCIVYYKNVRGTFITASFLLSAVNNNITFYARKQNASRVFAIVWGSVRLSVCHTRGLYQNGAS